MGQSAARDRLKGSFYQVLNERIDSDSDNDDVSDGEGPEVDWILQEHSRRASDGRFRLNPQYSFIETGDTNMNRALEDQKESDQYFWEVFNGLYAWITELVATLRDLARLAPGLDERLMQQLDSVEDAAVLVSSLLYVNEMDVRGNEKKKNIFASRLSSALFNSHSKSKERMRRIKKMRHLRKKLMLIVKIIFHTAQNTLKP